MKKWWQSKTLWLNGITFVLTAGFAVLEASLPELKGLVSPLVYVYISIALAMANALLRFITSQPIK
jgi:hypothetical protein